MLHAAHDPLIFAEASLPHLRNSTDLLKNIKPLQIPVWQSAFSNWDDDYDDDDDDNDDDDDDVNDDDNDDEDVCKSAFSTQLSGVILKLIWLQLLLVQNKIDPFYIFADLQILHIHCRSAANIFQI